jgi:hypothetical protein
MSLQITETLAANNYATQYVNQLNAIVSALNSAVTNGIPARGNAPAVTASDITTALGTANLAIVTAVIAAVAPAS